MYRVWHKKCTEIRIDCLRRLLIPARIRQGRTFTHNCLREGVRLSNFIRVAKATDFPEGCGRAVNVGHKLVAVFKIDGHFYAVNNICPHMGGSLVSGTINGLEIVCPSHRMCYDLQTGDSTDTFGHKIQTYDVKVEEGDLFIDAWWAVPKPVHAKVGAAQPAARITPKPSEHRLRETEKAAPLLSVVNGNGTSDH
jgi:nitrite reductase/ring-hydroxylating ferredoxin subunit